MVFANKRETLMMESLIARSMRMACLLGALALGPVAAMAQAMPDWTVVNGGATASMVAVDRSNNAFVAGTTSAPAIQLSKIGPSGAVLWQRGFTAGPGLSRSTWVSVDGAGNALVTGATVDFAGTPQGAAIMKFDPAGNLQWQDVIKSTYAFAARAEADAAGNVYVLWRAVQINASGQATTDMKITKYSPAGLAQWTQSSGASYATADGMLVMPGGNVVVAGTSPAIGASRVAAFDSLGNPLWSTSIPSSTEPGLAAAPAGGFYAVGGDSQGFLAFRFDASFQELWRRSIPARGVAQRVAVDTAGQAVLSGPVDTNTGMLQVVLYDWLTVKLDPAGTVLWSRTYGHPTSMAGDVPRSLAVGSGNAVYVTGQGNAVDAQGFLSSSTVTIKYAADGTQLWVANTSASTQGVGVKLGSDGGVFVAGQSPQTLYRYSQTGAPNLAPTAVASASPSAGPAPLTVAFSAAGSTDPDGLIAAYAWDFGDGQTSTAANPSHVYSVAGSYTARLTVTDTVGAAAAAAPIAITANLAVVPPTPTSLTLAAASVTGGSSTTASVTVSGSAGVTLALVSSNPKVASVPAIVTIPAGATSATFAVRTAKVSRDTDVVLQATANGTSAKAALTVRRR